MTIEEIEDEIDRLKAVEPGEKLGWSRNRLVATLNELAKALERNEEMEAQIDVAVKMLERRASDASDASDFNPTSKLSRQDLERIARGGHHGDELWRLSAIRELRNRDKCTTPAGKNDSTPPLFPAHCYHTA